MRYTLVGGAIALGVWRFNRPITLCLAVCAYLCAPYLAYPGDARRYLRRRRTQQRYASSLDPEYGSVLETGRSADQIRLAISGEIKPFRVFFSSTFRDLAKERDLLAKEVFPQLAVECERRGAVWSPIDLRWGITELQQNAGEVIAICLGSVERSRPNTIGVVGSRYGTQLPFTTADRESLPPWITQSEGMSLTHLELRHAAHPNPSAVSIFVMNWPRIAGPDEQGIRSMLTELRDDGAHVVDGVTDSHELAELVAADLRNRLDEQVPDTGLDNSLLREISAHALMERRLSECPAINVQVLDQANRHLAAGTVTVLRGASGSGRSTQVATWAAAWRQRHTDDIVVCRFIGLTEGSQTWAQVLRSIVAEISIRTGQPMRLPDRDEELALVAAFRFLETQRQHRVVVGIDGLDRLEARGDLEQIFARSLGWVPQQGSANRLSFVPILATDDLQDDSTFAFPVATIDIPPLSGADRSALIGSSLAAVDRHLSESDTEALVSHPNTGSPAFLGLVLDEMHKVASHDQVSVALKGLLSASSMDELVALALNRVERELEPGRVYGLHALLALLVGSSAGYTTVEIVDILSEQQHGVNQSELAILRWRLASLLSEIDGKLRVAPAFVDAVGRRVDNEALHTCLRRAKTVYYSHDSRRFTPHSIREMASLPSFEGVPSLRATVADPRGLLGLRAAYGSAYQFVLGEIARLSEIQVTDILSEVANGLDQGSPDLRLGFAEVCFDYSRIDMATQQLELVPRNDNESDPAHLDRLHAILGRLALAGGKPLSEEDWEAVFIRASKTRSANAQLALCGMGFAAALRGDLFWSKKYFERAVHVCFATGDSKGLAISAVNAVVAMLEGISDPLRTILGSNLRALFDAVAATGFTSGDLRLLMTGVFRRSVMDLLQSKPEAAREGFELAYQVATELGNERYSELSRIGLAAAMETMHGKDVEQHSVGNLSESFYGPIGTLELELLTLII